MWNGIVNVFFALALVDSEKGLLVVSEGRNVRVFGSGGDDRIHAFLLEFLEAGGNAFGNSCRALGKGTTIDGPEARGAGVFVRRGFYWRKFSAGGWLVRERDTRSNTVLVLGVVGTPCLCEIVLLELGYITLGLFV